MRDAALRCRVTNDVHKTGLLLCLQKYGISGWLVEITDASLTNKEKINAL